MTGEEVVFRQAGAFFSATATMPGVGTYPGLNGPERAGETRRILLAVWFPWQAPRTAPKLATPAGRNGLRLGSSREYHKPDETYRTCGFN